MKINKNKNLKNEATFCEVTYFTGSFAYVL